MIIRVTNTEYETDDGVVTQLPFELDYVPTVEEFQKMYDEWFRIFQQKGLIEDVK
jgi:sporulation-control protein spo0M